MAEEWDTHKHNRTSLEREYRWFFHQQLKLFVFCSFDKNLNCQYVSCLVLITDGRVEPTIQTKQHTHTHKKRINASRRTATACFSFEGKSEYSQLCHSFHKWTCVTKWTLLKREQTSFPGIPQTVTAMWSNPTQGTNVKMNWYCDTIK